jgi:hypothetical protein
MIFPTSIAGWRLSPTPKNDGVRQWGWHDIPYKKWKIELMFQTTNQSFSNLSDEITKVLYK